MALRRKRAESQDSQRPISKQNKVYVRDFTIRECSFSPTAIIIEAAILTAGTQEKVSAHLDTGASHSFCSHTISQKLGASSTLTPPTKVEMADGSHTVATRHHETRLRFPAVPRTQFLVDLRVLPNLPVDIILGLDFLIDNEAKFDLKAKFVTLGGNAGASVTR